MFALESFFMCSYRNQVAEVVKTFEAFCDTKLVGVRYETER